MATKSTTAPMSSAEMIALTKRHTIFEWSAQADVDPDSRGRAPKAATSGRPRASGTSTSTAS